MLRARAPKLRRYQFRRNSLEHSREPNMGTARERGIANAQKELVEARVSPSYERVPPSSRKGYADRRRPIRRSTSLLGVTNSGVVAKVVELPRFNALVELKLIQHAGETIIVDAQIQIGRTSLESEELCLVRIRCRPLDGMALREILRHLRRRHRPRASASACQDRRPDCEWSSCPW